MARSVRAWWLLCAVLPGLFLELSSCSDDAASAGDPADAAPDTKQRPAPVEDAEAEDADAGVTKPPPVLPACMGSSVPLVPSGERAYVGVSFGSDAGGGAGDAGDAGDAGAIIGDFLLDFGANGSTVDLKGFPATGAPTPASCLGDASAPGALCSFDHFDFFGLWGTVQLYTADYGFLFNSVRQAGIIGTDFLSNYPFALDYGHQLVWRSQIGTFCTDAQLLGAGLSPLPAGGFYTNKPGTLRPLSDVINDPDAAATTGFSVPNIPTVPITIAGVSALAQLDTGYDDRIIRHSININDAMLQRLLAESPDKITRRQSKDLYLTTCVPGLSQLGAAYSLAPGTAVNFVGAGGTVARNDTGSILFVKERLPAAERCGGIETWTVPAAQMGASFLFDAQAVVFDPTTSRVWLPK
jgi:hypothetical protein